MTDDVAMFGISIVGVVVYFVWVFVPWSCLRRGHCRHATGKTLAETRITHERGVYLTTVEETACCRCYTHAWREREDAALAREAR